MRLLKLIPDDTSIDFMRQHKIWLPVSLLTILLTVVLLFTKGLNLGIDFTGGLLMEVKTPAALQVADIRATLSTFSEGTPSIQEFGDNEVMIKIPGRAADADTQKRLYAEVQKLLGGEVEFRRVEYVGPQVGKELVITGIKAFAYAMVGILLYIWFRFDWQLGVSSIVALLHDVAVTILFFIITRIEFDLATVAAVLMVAGYSINDSVVISDRIREMLRKYRKMPLYDLLNKAINDTLSRTIMTGVTTVLALAALAIFGGAAIKGFTYALLLGVFVGMYSSIYVAAPLLLYMNVRRIPDDATEGTEQVTVQ